MEEEEEAEEAERRLRAARIRGCRIPALDIKGRLVGRP